MYPLAATALKPEKHIVNFRPGCVEKTEAKIEKLSCKKGRCRSSLKAYLHIRFNGLILKFNVIWTEMILFK
jgi:hypothetical protein